MTVSGTQGAARPGGSAGWRPEREPGTSPSSCWRTFRSAPGFAPLPRTAEGRPPVAGRCATARSGIASMPEVVPGDSARANRYDRDVPSHGL